VLFCPLLDRNNGEVLVISAASEIDTEIFVEIAAKFVEIDTEIFVEIDAMFVEIVAEIFVEIAAKFVEIDTEIGAVVGRLHLKVVWQELCSLYIRNFPELILLLYNILIVQR